MVGLDWVTALDRAVFVHINHNFRSPIMDVIFTFISDLGLGHIQAISIVLAAVISGARAGEFAMGVSFARIKLSIVSRKHWVYPLLLAFSLSGILSTVIKHSVDRDRPWGYYSKEHSQGREMGVTLVPPLRGPLKAHGFLSGHTATSFAIATALSLVIRRRKRGIAIAIVGWTLAVLIGFSRIYVVDHWPLDVVAGAIIGVLCGAIASYLCEKSSWTVKNGVEEPLATI